MTGDETPQRGNLVNEEKRLRESRTSKGAQRGAETNREMADRFAAKVLPVITRRR